MTIALREPNLSQFVGELRAPTQMFSLEIDYTPRLLWRLQHKGHQMEARLMPHAQYIAVDILVDGQLRAAEAFEHQTDALRWAEEQRVINADAPR